MFGLPNQRCLADAVDHQGATALHVATEKGAIEVCWLLLRSAGLHILHMKNHTGLTPLDLCSRGTTFRCVDHRHSLFSCSSLSREVML